MTILRSLPLRTTLLAMLAAAGAASLALSVLPSIPVARPESHIRDGSSAKTIPSITTPSSVTYDAIVQRPLFNWQRQPDKIPPPPPPPVPKPPAITAYRLVALVVSPQMSLAIVKRQGGGKAIRIRQGDKLDGWTVSAVTTAGVTLSYDGESAELTIMKFGLASDNVSARVAASGN